MMSVSSTSPRGNTAKYSGPLQLKISQRSTNYGRHTKYICPPTELERTWPTKVATGSSEEAPPADSLLWFDYDTAYNGSFYPVQIFMDNGQVYKATGGLHMRMTVSHLDDKGNDSNFYNSASAEGNAQKTVYWFNAIKVYVYGHVKVKFEIVNHPEIEPLSFVINVEFDKDGRPDPQKVLKPDGQLGDNEMYDYEFQPIAEELKEKGKNGQLTGQLPYTPYKAPIKPRRPKKLASADNPYEKPYSSSRKRANSIGDGSIGSMDLSPRNKAADTLLDIRKSPVGSHHGSESSLGGRSPTMENGGDDGLDADTAAKELPTSGNVVEGTSTTGVTSKEKSNHHIASTSSGTSGNTSKDEDSAKGKEVSVLAIDHVLTPPGDSDINVSPKRHSNCCSSATSAVAVNATESKPTPSSRSVTSGVWTHELKSRYMVLEEYEGMLTLPCGAVVKLRRNITRHRRACSYCETMALEEVLQSVLTHTMPLLIQQRQGKRSAALPSTSPSLSSPLPPSVAMPSSFKDSEMDNDDGVMMAMPIASASQSTNAFFQKLFNPLPAPSMSTMATQTTEAVEKEEIVLVPTSTSSSSTTLPPITGLEETGISSAGELLDSSDEDASKMITTMSCDDTTIATAIPVPVEEEVTTATNGTPTTTATATATATAAAAATTTTTTTTTTVSVPVEQEEEEVGWDVNDEEIDADSKLQCQKDATESLGAEAKVKQQAVSQNTLEAELQIVQGICTKIVAQIDSMPKSDSQCGAISDFVREMLPARDAFQSEEQPDLQKIGASEIMRTGLQALSDSIRQDGGVELAELLEHLYSPLMRREAIMKQAANAAASNSSTSTSIASTTARGRPAGKKQGPPARGNRQADRASSAEKGDILEEEDVVDQWQTIERQIAVLIGQIDTVVKSEQGDQYWSVFQSGVIEFKVKNPAISNIEKSQWLSREMRHLLDKLAEINSDPGYSSFSVSTLTANCRELADLFVQAGQVLAKVEGLREANQEVCSTLMERKNAVVGALEENQQSIEELTKSRGEAMAWMAHKSELETVATNPKRSAVEVAVWRLSRLRYLIDILQVGRKKGSKVGPLIVKLMDNKTLVMELVEIECEMKKFHRVVNALYNPAYPPSQPALKVSEESASAEKKNGKGTKRKQVASASTSDDQEQPADSTSNEQAVSVAEQVNGTPSASAASETVSPKKARMKLSPHYIRAAALMHVDAVSSTASNDPLDMQPTLANEEQKVDISQMIQVGKDGSLMFRDEQGNWMPKKNGASTNAVAVSTSSSSNGVGASIKADSQPSFAQDLLQLTPILSLPESFNCARTARGTLAAIQARGNLNSDQLRTVRMLKDQLKARQSIDKTIQELLNV